MAGNRRTCASCATTNEEDARFCEGCGGTLARTCTACGLEATATARFCRGCGTPLDTPGLPAAAPPAQAAARKTVTVMFADLAGSTSFEERVDAETARDVMSRYHHLLRQTAQRHRAGVTKYIGDGFMAVWGIPGIRPDDAADAVEAAVELQERFVDLAAFVADAHGTELALRVAVNTGEVVVGAGDADLVGDALNVGARLEAECPLGRVVVGEETRRATRGRYTYESLGHVQVKGRTAPVAVHRWLGHQSAADATPFVGRTHEVEKLQTVLDDAVTARAARLVTVIGDPGVGKSRLAAEFTAGAVPRVRVIEARCDVEGTVALAPIIEVLRALDLEKVLPTGVPEHDRLLRDLNGLAAGVPGSVEETFWALRRFIELLASDGPLLLVVDDIHWADTLLLDFVEHLVEWVHDVPVFVLGLARPELREVRPELVSTGRWVSAALPLGGLDAEATAELAAKVLDADRLPAELLLRLPSSTGGNPLFVRELMSMLAHDDVLVSEPGGWRLTIDVDAITVPPTIHALLASRLERLSPTDRRVLEVAAVVGSDFSVGAVCELVGSDPARIIESLGRLRRLELTQPSGAYVGDEPVWRFHHALIRDVAYRRLLKSDRADLHERLADWVASGRPSGAFDSDEMIARHLEAACAYRNELGTPGEESDGLALRAARHYAASARRALDRDELLSAGNQATRGAALAATDHAVLADLLLIGCEAFLSAGDVAAGAPLVDGLDRIADQALAPWAICYRSQLAVYTDPERLPDVDIQLQSAIDEFSRRAELAGLAKAHRVRAGARARLGRIGDCEADLFEALIAARHSGDHRQITAALGAAPAAALWGPSPLPKAGGRCLDVVRMQRMTTAAPSLEATSLRCLALLELLRGRPDKARSMLAEARQVVADLGLRHGLKETELFAGIIESMEGDPVAAEPHFRTALEGLDALGVGADAGLAAALLARSVLAQDRVEEADRHAAESEHLAGHNLKTAIAWRAVRAEILAVEGRHDEAAAMGRDAVAVAEGTDLVLDHADACLALSRVLAAAGDTGGANSARAEADRLYAAKDVASTVGRVADADEPTASTPLHTARAPTSARLAVDNRSCAYLPAFLRAVQAHDVEGTLDWYSDRFVYDDRRRLAGDPVVGRDAMRAAIERIFAQYSRFDIRVLAVRGERLHLVWTRWADDDGNETTTFYVNETGDDGRLVYHARFDEDDFLDAYRELEDRYYAGEGAAFAEGGTVSSQWIIAMNEGDFDRAFVELTSPQMRVENRSRALFPDRSVAEFRATMEGLDAMVSFTRTWLSAVHWLAPHCGIFTLERQAAGQDGELYTWRRLCANEFGNGQLLSMCEFELEDEEAAFAYAAALFRTTSSRLAVENRAGQTSDALLTAARSGDLDTMFACYSDELVYDDRRRLSGNPLSGSDALREAQRRILEQYHHFDMHTLAVRGQRLHLGRSRWSNDAGYETTCLHVSEIGEDGRFIYEGRFDEDNFEDAFRVLERRFHAGEGAAFAEAGSVATEVTLATNKGDFDRVFGELTTPDFHVASGTRSVFGDRSAAELRATFEELYAMVTSVRTWFSAASWLSPTCCIGRNEREAVGHDGERYAWTRIYVCEFRDGRLASMCEFAVEDEEAGFAYAEERARAADSRLAVTNKAAETAAALARAARQRDRDGMFGCYAGRFVHEDRRRLTGDAIDDGAALRAAIDRVLQQYHRFEERTLAVRGDRLHLGWGRWSSAAGDETAHLYVHEVGADGRIEYDGRFDEDDFDGAYRELERRYYADEGSDFAEAGVVTVEYALAVNAGDLDRVFGDLTTADFRLVEKRSRSVFGGDLSLAEFRASFEQLNALVASTRTWGSAVCWLTPTVVVGRFERDAVGPGGEEYAWTHIDVYEIRDGRLAAASMFDADAETAAFAYAEERVRAASSPLPLTNRSCDVVQAMNDALCSGDVDGIMRHCSERTVFDDRRRISGAPIRGTGEFRAAFERLCAQYNHSEIHILAVRGETLNLHWSRWSDDAGNESVQLHVVEIDRDGLIASESRFDEQDFDAACRELEHRYYGGEGAPFALNGLMSSEAPILVNRNEFDRLFDELCAPGMQVENRSHSAFPDRSASELRGTFGTLNTLVASTRTWVSAVNWLSPACSLIRLEREAVGQDGERYAWTMVIVTEHRDGRIASMCEFSADDEEAAFAYAEECVRAERG
ncbi:nuclear transport factor 2 family protein [Mycobacterium sp. NPDC050041]|uniref:nuclear transport factor 2 family protein n=1 Tax=Mycobacterium sp. NPDC050041 TaxID=3364293 RepID=UPI003C2D884A